MASDKTAPAPVYVSGMRGSQKPKTVLDEVSIKKIDNGHSVKTRMKPAPGTKDYSYPDPTELAFQDGHEDEMFDHVRKQLGIKKAAPAAQK